VPKASRGVLEENRKENRKWTEQYKTTKRDWKDVGIVCQGLCQLDVQLPVLGTLTSFDFDPGFCLVKRQEVKGNRRTR
jgi:hypothetical protein